MYVIGHIIFGIPLNEEIEEEFDRLELCVDDFFETIYHGSAPSTQGWCGVKLSSFDELRNIKRSSSHRKPS
jgi:hypothetical protein